MTVNTRTSFWPRYKEIPRLNVYLSWVFHGLRQGPLWKELFQVLLLYGICVCLNFYATLPNANMDALEQMIGSWWIYEIVDKFFTGFALSHASALSVGIFALQPFHKRLIASNLSLAKRYTWGELLFFALLAGILVAGLVKNNVLESTWTSIAVSCILLFLGAILIRTIGIELVRLGYPLYSLYVLLILESYLKGIVQTADYTRLIVILFLLVIFAVSKMLLSRKKIHQPVWNVSGKNIEKKSVSFEWISLKLSDMILRGNLIYFALLLVALHFFGVSVVSLESTSWMGLLALAFSALFTYWVANDIVPLFPEYNSYEIARNMKSRYWTFRHIRPGLETAEFLRLQYKDLLKRCYVFLILAYSLVWVTSFGYSQFFNTPLFDMGSLILTHLLLVAVAILNEIAVKTENFGKLSLSKFTWNYGSSASTTFEPEKVNALEGPGKLIDSFITGFFSHSQRDQVKQLLKNCETMRDYVNCIPELYRLSSEQEREEEKNMTLTERLWGSLVSTFVFAIFLGGVFGLCLIFFQIFFPGENLSTLTSGEKFAISITFILPLCLHLFYSISKKNG